MIKLSKNQKKQILLARLFELMVLKGEDLFAFMGKPLSFYDWDKVVESIKRKEMDEYGEIITNGNILNFNN